MEWTWCVAAFGLAFALAIALRGTLAVPPLLRTNFRGREIPTAGGVIAVLAFILIVAVASRADQIRLVFSGPALTLIIGFALLGLFDDVVGTHAARGLRGHLRAARNGQLTSGAVKLLFGLVFAWAAVPFLPDRERVLATVVIAGAANAANLFDLAPARATKVAVLAIGSLAAFSGNLYFGNGTYWFVAAVLALVPFELREELMLGDTGANALGACVGYLFVVESGGSAVFLTVAAVVVLCINIAGELVSFSRVIERVAPLRAVDRLGRRP